jgi:hypothetical protein
LYPAGLHLEVFWTNPAQALTCIQFFLPHLEDDMTSHMI